MTEGVTYFVSRAGEERQLGEVTVLKRERPADKTLNRESMLRPERSQAVRNHSPDGFEFGYGGSGPAQLALAILLDFTDSVPRALAHYQDFKFAFIAKLQHPGGEITAAAINDWLAKKERAS